MSINSTYLLSVEFPSFQSKKTFSFKKTALVRDVIVKSHQHLVIKRIPVDASSDSYGLFVPSKYRKGTFLPKDYTLVSLVEGGKLRSDPERPNSIQTLLHFKKTTELRVSIRFGRKKREIPVDDRVPIEDIIPSIANHFGVTNSANFCLKIEGKDAPLSMSSTLAENGISSGFQLLLEAPSSPTAVFGKPLQQAVRYAGSNIPSVVLKCVNFLTRFALTQEGIFRLSGSATDIADYKEAFDTGKDVSIPIGTDPNMVAGLLKLYLRELPEPLLTYKRWSDLVHLKSISNEIYRKEYVRRLVNGLHIANFETLKIICELLSKIAENVATTRMGIDNLATLIGPNILRNPKESTKTLMIDSTHQFHIAQILIDDHKFVFSPQVPLFLDATNLRRCTNIIFARANFEYNAQNDSELSLKPGIIISIKQSHAKGNWWRGESNGASGHFPHNFVTILDFKTGLSAPPTIPPQSNTTSSTSEGTSILTNTQQLKFESEIKDLKDANSKLDKQVEDLKNQLQNAENTVSQFQNTCLLLEKSINQLTKKVSLMSEERKTLQQYVAKLGQESGLE